FRDAMARVPAPVTIVTTADEEGNPYGTTVSAFASLSVTPPMVLFALDNRGAMRDRITLSGRVGVNILAGGQDEIAIRFAKPGLRFDDTDWHMDRGVPRIDGAAAFLHCHEVELLPGGDHTVVLGTVDTAESAGDVSLSYHLRAFHAVPPAALG
ncbi:MAG: flavin reductase family protein, partial [Propionibacterium sp.]|nr:flavin reductase family protein [Propionibacterium sp.]